MVKSKVFTLYAFVDAAAELTAGPLMARLLAIGRTDDHPSNGVCFLASSVSLNCSKVFSKLLINMCLGYIPVLVDMGCFCESGKSIMIIILFYGAPQHPKPEINLHLNSFALCIPSVLA
jgi:hypothetical protein